MDSLVHASNSRPIFLRVGLRSLRYKPAKDMAFPHPQSRKEQYRKKAIPNSGRVVLSIRRRIIDVTNHRNAEDDVDPAKNRTFGGFFHDESVLLLSAIPGRITLA